MDPTKEELEHDAKVYEEMEKLRWIINRTQEQEKKFVQLFREYYMKNDWIRIWYKTR